jgi:hypothetical protein
MPKLILVLATIAFAGLALAATSLSPSALAKTEPLPLTVTSIGTAQQTGTGSAGQEGAKSASPLAGCELTDVIVDIVPSANSAITQSQAEHEALGIGARGPASLATLARVTIVVALEPAVQVKRDLSGQPIMDRPAWVLVFRNQHITLPGGAIPARLGAPAPPRKPHVATTVATIIDAESGRFIYGWNC